MAARSIFTLRSFFSLLLLWLDLSRNNYLRPGTRDVHLFIGPDSDALCCLRQQNYCHHLYSINFRVVFKRVEASSNSKITFLINKTTKHGIIILALPSKPSSIDILICMDVHPNPGPCTMSENHVNRPVMVNASDSNCHTFHRIKYSKSVLFGLRHKYAVSDELIRKLKNQDIIRTRGTRAGQSIKDRTNNIPVRITCRSSEKGLNKYFSRQGANLHTLCNVKREEHVYPTSNSKSYRNVNFCLLNTRSIRNKSDLIKEFLLDSKLDILALTETWLQGNNDQYSIRDITPTNYVFKHIDRKSRGGGVGLIYNKAFNFKSKPRNEFRSFELIDVVISGSNSIRVTVIYRPPPSNTNHLTLELFFTESRAFLEEINNEPGRLLISGDFNFHIDDVNNNNSKKFLELINDFNLKQHVTQTTHIDNHILDLIITRHNDDIVHSISVQDPGISDHYAVHAKIHIEKPTYPRKEIQYRNLKNLNYHNLCKDINNSPLVLDSANSSSVSDITGKYDSTLTTILDLYAPIKRKTITIRPNSPWYTDEIKQLKIIKRRLERRWRTTKLPSDRDAYAKHCVKVNTSIFNSKMSFYSSIIDQHKNDQKVLFDTVKKMLHTTTENLYPSSESPEKLANNFADFFINKIIKIRDELAPPSLLPTNLLSDYDTAAETAYSPIAEFTNFTSVSEDQLSKLIYKLTSKSCEIDPIPASVLKHCLHVLLPVITKIVNLSLSNAVMPPSLKIALLNPRLKKPSIDHEEFSNFRPISNLKFVSKVIEKTVATQVNDYINENNMNEFFQSAYKINHSTETALIRVNNDILRALDDKKSVILLLLDLSAAFDTVDHTILLTRLNRRLGFKGAVLDWFSSYLSGRKQFVRVNGAQSILHDLTYGLPQGSVLGPLLFLLYTLPLADVIRKHDMGFHLYADDTQLYLSFDSSEEQLAHEKIEACTHDIDKWMSDNMLKMNRGKTELLILHARHRLPPEISSVSVCNAAIEPSTSVKNIGVTFDPTMSMENHINVICKSAFFHLRNISRIRKYLSSQSAETLVHAFITTRLDFCNSLLYGLPNQLIQRLQSVQNSAARLISLTTKYEHISPILRELHWLPVQYRIHFKIILLTFKCFNNSAPAYLKDLIEQYVPRRALRSGNKNYLTIPRYKLKTYGRRSFSVAAPLLWNSLPQDMRDATIHPEVFKKKLKTYFFKTAFNI